MQYLESKAASKNTILPTPRHPGSRDCSSQDLPPSCSFFEGIYLIQARQNPLRSYHRVPALSPTLCRCISVVKSGWKPREEWPGSPGASEEVDLVAKIAFQFSRVDMSSSGSTRAVAAPSMRCFSQRSLLGRHRLIAADLLSLHL